jgi:hypothetical protein
MKMFCHKMICCPNDNGRILLSLAEWDKEDYDDTNWLAIGGGVAGCVIFFAVLIVCGVRHHYTMRAQAIQRAQIVGHTNLAMTGVNPPGYPIQAGGNPPSHPTRAVVNPPGYPIQAGGNPPSHPTQAVVNPPGYPIQAGGNRPSYTTRAGANPPNYTTQGGINTASYPPQSGGYPPSYPPQAGVNPSSYPTQATVIPHNYTTRDGVNPLSYPTQAGVNPLGYPTQTQDPRPYNTHPGPQVGIQASASAPPYNPEFSKCAPPAECGQGPPPTATNYGMPAPPAYEASVCYGDTGDSAATAPGDAPPAYQSHR